MNNGPRNGYNCLLFTHIMNRYPGSPKFLLSVYSQATSKLYGCILFDLNQNKTEDLCVVTDIFDNEITVYLLVKSKTKVISCRHGRNYIEETISE